MIKKLLEEHDHDLQVITQRIQALQQELQDAQIIQQRLIGGKKVLMRLQQDVTEE